MVGCWAIPRLRQAGSGTTATTGTGLALVGTNPSHPVDIHRIHLRRGTVKPVVVPEP